MKRLMSVIGLDMTMQLRYGFLYAAAFSILLWVAVLLAVPASSLGKVLPAIVFFDVAVVGFYFIAGMVIYEKDEQTLSAIVVSPLRFWEYLTSKLFTLTLLALVLSIILVMVSVGFGFNLLLLAAGTMLMSIISLLTGFIAVSPFQSLSSYLIPSTLYATILYLPLVAHIGWWKNPVYYLLPTQGALRLISGAFEPIAIWEIVYAVLYGSAWITGLWFIAKWMFNHYMIMRKGG